MNKSYLRDRIGAGDVVKVTGGYRRGKYGIVLYSFDYEGKLSYRVKYAGDLRLISFDGNKCYEDPSNLHLVRKTPLYRKFTPYRRELMETTVSGIMAIIFARRLITSNPWLCLGLSVLFGIACLVSLKQLYQKARWGDYWSAL